MGLTRATPLADALAGTGPLGTAALAVSLGVLLFTLVCYLAAFPRRRRDARAVRPPAGGTTPPAPLPGEPAGGP